MSSSSPDTAPSSDSNNNNNNSDNNNNNSNSNSSSSTPPPPPSPNSPSNSNSPPPPDSSSNSNTPTSSPAPPDSSSNSDSNSNSPSGSKSSPSPPSPSQSNGNRAPSPQSNSNSSTPSSGLSPSTPNLTPKSSKPTSSTTPSPPALSGSGKGSDGGKETNARAIVGGALGVGCVLLIMIIVCVICNRKKKRKQMYYYNDASDGKGGKSGAGYYSSGPGPNHNNWHVGGNDHVVRMQQSPGGMGMGLGPNSNSSGWGPVPPPPPPHSTDISSNYSLGPPPLPPPSPGLALGLNGGTFTYEDLAAATEGFADRNLLGQGGFGYVHKGVLPNGKEVAVKSLKAGSGQGEREFQAEIDMLSRVHHRHLVSLNGYCIAGGQRMLVYEFVPNKTLEHHLHGKGLPTMTWRDRMRIAIGSAKGLAYLHEDCHPRIIHRDIKSANVLLDDSFEAKVADFGLAKLTTDNNTHVSTRVMGTFGYLAPEYASSGKLTEKSDVFSFGVMLLELITGKRPVDVLNVMDDSLVDWARPLLTRGLEDGHFEELVDSFLEGNYNEQEMARMAACASASIRHSGKKRPKMSQIVRALEGDVSLEDLNEGAKPGHSNILASSSSSDYDSSAYHADMKRFRQIALSSQDFGSSEGSSGEMPHRHIPRQPL